MNKTRLTLMVLLVMITLPITTVEAQDTKLTISAPSTLTEGSSFKFTIRLENAQGYTAFSTEFSSDYSVKTGYVGPHYFDSDHNIYSFTYPMNPVWDTIGYGFINVEATGPNVPTITADISIKITEETTSTNPYTQQTTISYLFIFSLIAICIILFIKHRERKSSTTTPTPANSTEPTVLPPQTSDAKVLIICPFCGAKTEQGITQCWKCKAPL